MNHARDLSHNDLDLHDSRLAKQQLAREIACLEGQLSRLRMRDDIIDYSTLQTYEEMILSRKRVLESFS